MGQPALKINPIDAALSRIVAVQKADRIASVEYGATHMISPDKAKP